MYLILSSKLTHGSRAINENTDNFNYKKLTANTTKNTYTKQAYPNPNDKYC